MPPFRKTFTMNRPSLSLHQMIAIRRNPDLPGVYDIQFQHLGRVRSYDLLECHIVLYPYSRQLNSGKIVLMPYEEYARDILAQQRSAYKQIGETAKNLFGVFLGLLLVLIFALIRPVELYSLASIVSIIGAYAIGKELWDDLENWMVNTTASTRIRFQPRYYNYQLEKNTTISKYFNLARTSRYGHPMLLPHRMDFIQQSNSQTVRMLFRVADLPTEGEGPVHVLSIHLPPALVKEFEEKGYLFGVKWGLINRIGLLLRSREIFQSMHGHSLGSLDTHNKWQEGKALLRETFSLGRIKFYWKNKVLEEVTLVTKLPVDKKNT